MAACKRFYSFSCLPSFLLPPSVPLCPPPPNTSHSCDVLGIAEVCLDTAVSPILTQQPDKRRICSLFASHRRQTLNPTSSLSERRWRYTCQAVLQPPRSTPPHPKCVYVCMYLSSPSFPRKEHRIYECMRRREQQHLQRRMSVSCKRLGGEGGRGTALNVCGWTAPIETLSSNT